jgi:hypothetical protein
MISLCALLFVLSVGPTDCIVEGEVLKLGGPFLQTWQKKHLKLYPNRLEFYPKNRDGQIVKGKGVEVSSHLKLFAAVIAKIFLLYQCAWNCLNETWGVRVLYWVCVYMKGAIALILMCRFVNETTMRQLQWVRMGSEWATYKLLKLRSSYSFNLFNCLLEIRCLHESLIEKFRFNVYFRFHQWMGHKTKWYTYLLKMQMLCLTTCVVAATSIKIVSVWLSATWARLKQLKSSFHFDKSIIVHNFIHLFIDMCYFLVSYRLFLW